MATMNISLPDDMKAFIEAEASRKGFGTVSEYMRTIIRENQERAARRGDIDSLLLEGLDSGPATPLGAADWETIRRQLDERNTARQGSTHAPKDTGHR